MAESKLSQPTESISLSRWSRLKRAAADEQAVSSAVRAAPVDALVASETGNDCLSASAKEHVAANADYAELPSISTISLAEDFTPFMQAKVPQALKQQALKALFKEPHFNVMDGLDIYIDDYTAFEPISPEVMATLSSWKTIMKPPQQVVTNGGYAVDVGSDEGKAVLAARAELAQTNAVLQPASDVQVPSPATLSDRHVAPISWAEGEGDESAASTSQTINPESTDEPPQVNEGALATALNPTPTPTPERTSAFAPERAAGERAKPHIRYGKRVGDFSASSYAATEQPLLDPADAEHVQTPSAAPKSITQ